jgi:protein phosphatase
VSTLVLPKPSLVALVGAAGSGKSTFAARWFAADDVLSSDAYRAMLTGDEADQRATKAAFSILHREVARRLVAGRSVVVDATNVERAARRALIARARTAGVPAVAIVFNLPPALVHERNRGRTGRVVDPSVVDRHLDRLARTLARHELVEEGFDDVVVLRSAADVDGTSVEWRSS